MWLCMKWHGAWLYGVHRTRRDGSSFLWHQPCQRCKHTTSLNSQKRAVKSYSLMSNHMRAQWVCSRERRIALYKSDQQQQQLTYLEEGYRKARLGVWWSACVRVCPTGGVVLTHSTSEYAVGAVWRKLAVGVGGGGRRTCVGVPCKHVLPGCLTVQRSTYRTGSTGARL